MFSQDTIEKVIAANDIVEVIGSYLPLKRAGTRFQALCPFHREKSPSFHVDPSRQRYHCFGCGKDGHVIRFVMEYESLDFPATVRRLAERAGVPIVDEHSTGGDYQAEEQKRRLYAVHSEAAEWFHRNLMKSADAQHARDYLKGRGLSAEVAARWRIGYAPNAYDALSNWARGRGYRAEELLLAGLTKRKEETSKSSYDRFRDRLMFSICDESSRVIAFSGRILAADSNMAKYVNSPETPIFTKGKVLFGLHQSKKAIIDAEQAIVCEGQIDLITVFEAGIRNVVAPQGTAFTEKQAHRLGQLAPEVILCFDADSAGQQAAERSFPALLANNLAVRVATMPPGEDPDSLIRAQGPEAFVGRIAAAQDFFDFQLERLSKMFDLGTAQGKTQMAKRIAASVALLTNQVLRDAVIFKVTARLGIAPEVFRQLLRTQPRAAAPRETPDLKGGEQAANAPEAPAAVKFDPPPTGIAHLLRLALVNPEARLWLQDQAWEELLPKVAGGELLEKALAADFKVEDPASVNAFLAGLSPAEEKFLSGLLGGKSFPQPMRVARDSWLDLEKGVLRERRAALEGQLRLPSLSDEEITQMQKEIKEILDLQKRLTDIARL